MKTILTIAIALSLTGCVDPDQQPCKDALIRPEAWSGAARLECPHPDHLMKPEGDRFICRCPRAREGYRHP